MRGTPHRDRSAPRRWWVVPLALAIGMSLSGGVAYSAAKVGTKDLRNGAVTSKKVRNGTLQARDLVREERPHVVGRGGAVPFNDGGDGDCWWRTGAEVTGGLGPAAYRVDRFGTVHLSGVALGVDNPDGGDGKCGEDADEAADRVAFVLPPALRPRYTQLRSTVIVVGTDGVQDGDLQFPPGAVVSPVPGAAVVLDGVSYPAAKSRVNAPQIEAKHGGELTLADVRGDAGVER